MIKKKKKKKRKSVHDRILMFKKKHPGGRPSKINDCDKRLLGDMLEIGMTDTQIASILLIDESTLHLWKKKNKEFIRSLKDWKINADGMVVRSLYQRACGYYHDEDKIHFYEGKFYTHKVRKYYPPSDVACFFWLANRQKDNWKHKPDENHSIEKLIPVVSHLTDVIKKKGKLK